MDLLGRDDRQGWPPVHLGSRWQAVSNHEAKQEEVVTITVLNGQLLKHRSRHAIGFGVSL